MVQSGDADGMMVIGRNPKREEWVRFSLPHFRTEYGIFVKADNGMPFTDMSQLEGLTVAVFSPSNTATQLKGLRHGMVAKGLVPIEIDERPDDDSGFRKLAAGRVDAVYSNGERGREILEAEGLTADVRYAGGHQGILYYAGFARGFPTQALTDRFDAAWRELFRRGEAQKIIERYGMEPAAVE
jgi:polar amino acid transport system substrate-binding protein